MKNNFANKLQGKMDSANTAMNDMLNARQDKDQLLAEIKEMIKHQCDLTDKIEGRRTQANHFALQGLALSITGTGIIITLARGIYPSVIQGFLAFLSVYAISGLLTSILFERQSSFRYPFLKLPQGGNSWRWFYYGNPIVQKLSRSMLSMSRDTKLKECDIFLDSLAYIIVSFRTF